MTAALASLPTALGPVARVADRQSSAAAHPLAISFEFSPPKTAEAEENLWTCIRRLEPLGPSFVSVTYGAGGSTRDRTHRTVKRILDETTLSPAAHLTCVDAPREEVDEVIQAYWDAGIRHIVALRGDPPGSIGGAYQPRSDGYANATELTAGITRLAPFEVSVGLYPQIHPESGSLAKDIDVLKAKVDAGATRAITQFFYDVEGFLRFMDRVRAAGVTIYTVGYGQLVYPSQQVLLAQIANSTNTTAGNPQVFTGSAVTSYTPGPGTAIPYNPSQPIGEEFYATNATDISNDFFQVGQAINAALTQ